MKRTDFFKKALSRFREQCEQQGVAAAERKFLVYLKNILKEKWPKVAPKIDRRAAGLPHHKEIGYDRKKAQPVVANWLAQRYLFMFGVPVCETCSSKEGPLFTSLGDVGTGLKGLWFRYCSDGCSKGSVEAKAKREATCTKKYGVRNIAQSKRFRKKMRKYWNQFDEDQRVQRNTKRNETLARKHGTVEKAHKLRAAKMVKTNIKRYGGPAATCSEEIKAKVVATNYARRGVSNPSKDPEVMQRINESWKKRKELILKGKLFTGLQGYEPQALTWMVSEAGVKVSSIKRPTFAVAYSLRGIQHVYHPDFYVEQAGKKILVEVKSIYTAAILKDTSAEHGHGEYARVRAKINACVALGYETRLLIWDKNTCFVWKNKLPRDRTRVLKKFYAS